MKNNRILLLWAVLIVSLGLFLSSCDNQTEYVFINQRTDSIPPGTIDNLIVSDTGYVNIGIAFTMPGDDGFEGDRPSIMVKKHNGDFTGFVWDQAETVYDKTAYVPAGEIAGININSLEMGQTYTIGVKAYDEAGNFSNLSNLVQVTTKVGMIDSSALYVGEDVWGLELADFDNNGYLDILTADNQSIKKVVMFRNNGDGLFMPPMYIASGEAPVKFVADDFNNDGELDFSVSNLGSSQIYVHYQDKDFASPTILFPNSAAFAVISADFDNNGYPDIATANYFYGDVRVMLNEGVSFSDGSTYPTGDHPRGLCAGDFDDDGYLDLAATSDAGGMLSLLFNKGDGTFDPAVDIDLAGGAADIQAGDFDDDGDLDLAIAVYAGDSSRVLVKMNNSDGTFTAGNDYLNGFHMYVLDVGDIDNDDDLDIVIARETLGLGLKILRNDGNGVFDNVYSIAYPRNSSDLKLGDMNNDNKLDIVVTCNDNDKIVIVDNPF